MGTPRVIAQIAVFHLDGQQTLIEVAPGDKIFCLNEDGVTFVVQTGPKFKLLHTNALAEDDMCMATPVIVGDRLLIRTAKWRRRSRPT